MKLPDVNINAHYWNTTRIRNYRPWYLVFVIAALLAVCLSAHPLGAAHAESSTTSKARSTAQVLVNRSDKLAGSTAVAPVLVYNLSNRKPAYYLVPVQRAGRTIALVGVSSNGLSWQWYTDSYTGQRFPAVSRAQAQAELGSAPIMVEGPGSKLFWTTALMNRFARVDVFGPTRSLAQVRATTPQVPTSLLGKYSVQNAADPKSVNRYSMTTSSLPVSRTLKVPYQYQVNSYFCGPATLDMIFDYYGPAVQSQYDLGHVMNAKNWGSWWGAYSDDLVRAAQFSSNSTAIQDSSLHGYKERWLGYAGVTNMWSYYGTSDPDYPNRYTDLKKLINAGYPVEILTWYGSTHQYGHFRVLVGYDDSTDSFIVNDPWYTAPYQGPNVHFQQGFLVDNLWVYARRWGAVISPWKVSVSAPTSAVGGRQFTVNATVIYPGPQPLSGRAPVTNSQATISVPSGFTVDSYTKSLPSIVSSGDQQSVSWTVTPPANYSGMVSIGVTAQARFTGSSTSYGSYTDWIGGYGAASRTSVQSAATAPIIVDNETVGRFKASTNWSVNSWNSQKNGASYRSVTPKKIGDYAMYKFKVPATANYQVYAWWPSASSYNRHVPIRIRTTGGWKVIWIDETKDGGQWRLLGSFRLAQGDQWNIAVSRWTWTKGYVMADAFKIQR